MLPCPYCNSDLAAQVRRAAGERLVCARCGEPVPPALATQLRDLPPGLADDHYAARQVPARRGAGNNRKIALGIVAGMVVMAAIGLTYALWTQSYRRANDYRAKKQKGDTSTLASASEWIGLGFLPPRVNVVAGLRVRDLRAAPATSKLLDAPRPTLLDWLVTTAEKWAGLRIEDVDHIVLGAEVKDQLPLVAVVLHTTKPYDPLEVAKALEPNKPSLFREGLLYRFTMRPGEGMLWCATPQTMILLVRFDALTDADLQAIPSTPRKPSEQLAPALADLFAKPEVKESVAWMAGRLDHPELLKSVALLAPKAKEDINAWSHLRSFAVALVPRDDLTLIGQFQVPDPTALAGLRERLEGLKPDHVKSYKVDAPPPEVLDPEQQWLILQLRAAPEQMRDVLDSLGGKWLRPNERRP